MSWTWTIFFLINFTFSSFSEARHHKDLAPAVVVGTVYCDTCFQQNLPKASHFIPGASVTVECKDSNFRQEVKTDQNGEFKVHLPFSISKHAKKIKDCSVKLISSNEPHCSIAASASSSTLHLKSRKEGTHIFSAGYFTFKPLKEPQLCNQKPITKNFLENLNPTLPTPIQQPPALGLNLPRLPSLPTLPSLPPLPHLPPLPGLPFLPPRSKSLELSDNKIDQLPIFPFPFNFFPPNAFQPPPSLLPPNPFQPPSSLLPPNPFQPPSSLLPPNPFQPPSSLVPPTFPSPPPSILPPLFPSLSPPPLFQVPPIRGILPSPPPPPPRTFPIPLPPFPFQPAPGLPIPGAPHVKVSSQSKNSP